VNEDENEKNDVGVWQTKGPVGRIDTKSMQTRKTGSRKNVSPAAVEQGDEVLNREETGRPIGVTGGKSTSMQRTLKTRTRRGN